MAKQAYNNRPVRFSVPGQAPVPVPVPVPDPVPISVPVLAPGLTPASAPAPTQPAPAQAEDEQNWTQVNNRRTKSPPAGPPEKRRKGPGRPLGSTKAAKNTKDIRDVFNGLYEGGPS